MLRDDRKIAHLPKVFFDLDGTLIDVSERYFAVYSAFMKSKGLKPISKDKFWRIIRSGLGARDVIKKDDLLHDYKKFFLKNIETSQFLKKNKLYSFSLPILKRLKRSGHGLFLITIRRSRKNLFRELKKMKLSIFDKVVIARPSCRTGENFLKKIKLIKGLAKSGDLIVGDSRADILCGKKLGLRTVAVLFGIRNRQYLNSLAPDYVIRDIRSLHKILKKIG